MKLDLEIHTTDTRLARDLMETRRIGNITSRTIAKGVTIEYEGTTHFEATDAIVIVSFTLKLVGLGSAGAASDWLDEHLRNRAVERLVINRTTVAVDAIEIRRVISEKLTEERPLARDLA